MKNFTNIKKTENNKSVFDVLKNEEKKIIGSVLYFLNQEDCNYTDFLDGGYFETLLYDLLYHNFLWVSSDERILLTKKGENFLNFLFQNLVEIDSKKIKFIHYEPKK